MNWIFAANGLWFGLIVSNYMTNQQVSYAALAVLAVSVFLELKYLNR